MDLTDQLNKGFIRPFQDYNGPIPEIAAGMKKEGRIFAGGNVVLKQRLDALESADKEKIDGWGNNHFDLADLCLCFEDLVALQPNSPLLTGIRGIASTQDGLFIAVDAEAVQAAISPKGWKYFKAQLSESEHVTYMTRNGKRCSEKAENIVLLPYNRASFELNRD